jgi:hypothetical protein
LDEIDERRKATAKATAAVEATLPTDWSAYVSVVKNHLAN